VPFRALTHDIRVFQFDNLAREPGVQHFVSTRAGGGSPPPYRSLNLSFHVGDDPNGVAANRRRLFAAADVPIAQVVACQQVHGAHVAIADDAVAGRGALDFDSALPATDAVVTATPGICLAILAADCVPLVAYDPVTHVAGLAHAGWRGTVRHVGAALLTRMHTNFACDPANVIVGIGPAIGPDDYEVGPEVIEQVRAAFPERWRELIRLLPNGKGHLDLWRANTLELVAAGVPAAQIEVAGISTYRATDTFFSDRREGPASGRFAACIQLLTS
jgi:YfiH family protein